MTSPAAEKILRTAAHTERGATLQAANESRGNTVQLSVLTFLQI